MSSWAQQAELTASDGASLDYFGGDSVALSGDGSSALVGAYGKNSNTGAAYVFASTSTPNRQVPAPPPQSTPTYTFADDNWTSQPQSNIVPAPTASAAVSITRFYGALAGDTGIIGTPQYGQLAQP